MEKFCENEGRELTGQERMDPPGLGHGHVWRICLAGMTFNDKQVANVVCRSNGCNEKCPKFQKPKPDEKRPEPKSREADGEAGAESVDLE